MMKNKLLPLVLVIFIASLACTISINGAGETAPADEFSMAEAVSGTQTAAAPAGSPIEEANPQEQPQEAAGQENDVQSPSQAAADLAIWQTLLRYDGQQPQGTFEITVCNLGVEKAPPFEADLTVNNITRRLASAEPLGQYACIGLFDPTSNFETFSVTQPGNVSVSAALHPTSQGDPAHNNTSQVEVALPSIGPISDDSLMHLYQECRQTSPHEDCLLYLSQDPPADPHMIKKQGGPVIVLAPADYDFLAEEYLAGNALCAEKMQAYMGIAPPHPITQHLVIGDGMGASHAAEIGIMVIVPPDSFPDLVDYLPDNWKATLTGVCRNEHEMTHLFLGDVPLPAWLNEGLATYIEGGERVTPELEGPLECRENGWYGNDWDDGQTKEMPYVNLVGTMDPDIHRYQYYYTASCFWDYLESNYGHEKFQQVLQKLVSYRDPVYHACSEETLSTYFMRDIVRPVIGDDITPITQARWGFGETFTGCEP
jgi:hypothetical protein